MVGIHPLFCAFSRWLPRSRAVTYSAVAKEAFRTSNLQSEQSKDMMLLETSGNTIVPPSNFRAEFSTPRLFPQQWYARVWNSQLRKLALVNGQKGEGQTVM